MPTISNYPWLSHLRAGPSEFIVHYNNGRVARSGRGLAYFFRPLTAAVAMVPVEDRETTFVIRERTADLQEVAVQCTLTYRVADPVAASERFNFTISLRTGTWQEKPLERLENAWGLRARDPARTYLSQVKVTEAVAHGPVAIRERLYQVLAADKEIAAMGLTLVDVVVDAVTPAPEVQKALETPTREAIQQKADGAVFERRAMAVEKERAIKENELATQIELVRRQEDLIKRQGANRVLDVRQSAEAEKAKAEAEIERKNLEAQAYAEQMRTRAAGDAEAQRLLAEAGFKAEELRAALYSRLDPEARRSLALRELATNLPRVNHLNVTPELLGDGIASFLRRQGEK